MELKVARLVPNAKIPTRKHPTDAGIDFYALVGGVVEPHSSKVFHTGICVEVLDHLVLLIFPKSRNNHLIGAGVVDAYYQPGEILVKVVNYSTEPLEIKEGEAIAQGVLFPIFTDKIVEVDALEMEDSSDRSGQGGIVWQI